MGERLAGKVCLVTGATGGVGQAVAKGLAREGATVVIVAREKGRGQVAEAGIRAAGALAPVQVLLGDLSSQGSIHRLAAEFRRIHPTLQVLVNSAAVFHGRRLTSPDGFELMFATNHLGYFLLTQLLLDPLKAGAPAAVFNLTAPSTTQLDFDDLQGERRFRALWAFGASKMANLLFTFGLARRLQGTGVIANAYHPGITRSRLMREAPAPLRWLTGIAAKNPDRAAAGLVDLAATYAGGRSGLLLHGTKSIDAPAYSRDEAVQDRLWQESLRLVGL